MGLVPEQIMGVTPLDEKNDDDPLDLVPYVQTHFHGINENEGTSAPEMMV